MSISTLDLAKNSLLEKPEKHGWYIEFVVYGIFTQKKKYIYVGSGLEMPDSSLISKKLSELANLKKDEIQSAEGSFRLIYIPTIDFNKVYNEHVLNLPGDRVRIRMNYLLNIFDYPRR